MKYKEAATPQEYLQNVLDNWTSFCEVNSGLARAISDLLIVNQTLTTTISLLLKKEVTAQKDSD